MHALYVTLILSASSFARIDASYAHDSVVVYADEAPYAAEEAMLYEGRCPSGLYRLRISQAQSRVELEIANRGRRTEDLSTSPFGRALLDKALHGKLYATCPETGAIGVYFYGVEPHPGPKLQPVKYRVTFNAHGEITSDGGLANETPFAVNHTFLDKRAH